MTTSLIQSEQKVEQEFVGKIEFPTWKGITYELIEHFGITTGKEINEMKVVCNQHFELIDKISKFIHERLREFHPIIVYQLSNQTACKKSSSLSLEETLDILKKIPLNSNEFYSVFDTSNGELVTVDERVRDVLGMAPEQITMKAMMGFDPENPLWHPDDLYHSIRFGTIAYQVLALPNLEFTALKDFFRARFRAGTDASYIPEIRELGYVTIEKKAYMIEDREVGSPLDMRVLYRWSVFVEDDFDGIKPYFASDPVRSKYMQDFWYLLHSYLIGISPKYIIMLENRKTYDRNKAIAAALNANILKHANVKSNFDEGQVADCFAKTIRPKIAEAINIWGKREVPLTIVSDQEAVMYAKRLGLLPVPTRVLDMMYKNILVL